jgi:hypothetical protein
MDDWVRAQLGLPSHENGGEDDTGGEDAAPALARASDAPETVACDSQLGADLLSILADTGENNSRGAPSPHPHPQPPTKLISYAEGGAGVEDPLDSTEDDPQRRAMSEGEARSLGLTIMSEAELRSSEAEAVYYP